VPRVKVSTILHLVQVLGDREMVVEVSEGATVAELMRLLAEHSDPGKADLLFADRSGSLQSSITIMVNGRHVAFLNGLNTILSEADEVLVLPAAGGG
jgi:sulfur-carrier protein